MTVPANNDAALVREALERDGWRMKDGARDYTLREDALAALDRLAATAERADEMEAAVESLEAERDILFKGDWAALNLRVETAEAALLVAQQERDEALKRVELLEVMDMTLTAEQWEGAAKAERKRREWAEATVTRLRKTLAILAECGEVTVEEIARAALAQDTEQETT